MRQIINQLGFHWASEAAYLMHLSLVCQGKATLHCDVQTIFGASSLTSIRRDDTHLTAAWTTILVLMTPADLEATILLHLYSELLYPLLRVTHVEVVSEVMPKHYFSWSWPLDLEALGSYWLAREQQPVDFENTFEFMLTEYDLSLGQVLQKQEKPWPLVSDFSCTGCLSGENSVRSFRMPVYRPSHTHSPRCHAQNWMIFFQSQACPKNSISASVRQQKWDPLHYEYRHAKAQAFSHSVCKRGGLLKHSAKISLLSENIEFTGHVMWNCP